MKTIRRKLASESGVSRIEAICIAGIGLFLVGALLFGFFYYREAERRSEDNHLEDTARRVAALDVIGSNCIVRGCDGQGCPHIIDGVSTGYFDHYNNSITGQLPLGYNSSRTMRADGVTYHGERGTMVIQVYYDGESYRLTWVKGKKNAAY